MGHLTKDPYVKRFGRENTAVAYMRLAINERRRTRSGEMVDTPVFVDVNAYEKLAELCEKYCHKGKNILFEGKLQVETRTSPEGRQTHRLFVRAQQVKFLSDSTRQNDYRPKNERVENEEVPTEADEAATADGDDFTPEESDGQTKW